MNKTAQGRRKDGLGKREGGGGMCMTIIMRQEIYLSRFFLEKMIKSRRRPFRSD